MYYGLSKVIAPLQCTYNCRIANKWTLGRRN
jgi:hypothetical protein